MMARYNAWQNSQVMAACAALDDAALRAERGAFFGSILKTLNHLLWGDGMWMSRFDGGDAPGGSIGDSTALCATIDDWTSARKAMDTRIITWTAQLTDEDLQAQLAWYSGAAGRNVTAPLGLCVTHMFNHQTHHRGQIHAMLTAAGAATGDTDLFLMPAEPPGGDPWL